MSLINNLWKKEKRLREVETYCQEITIDEPATDFDKGYQALASEILALIDMGPST